MGKPILPAPPAPRAACSWRRSALLVLSALAFLVCGPPSAFAGGSASTDTLFTVPETEFHILTDASERVQLAHAYVDPASVRVIVDGVPWQEGEDFRLRPREGLWIPLRQWGTREVPEGLLIISYRFQPVPLSPRLDLHPIFTRADVFTPDSAAVRQPQAAVVGLPTGQLSVRGSKAVRIASGNRREMTVDQTLRLAISGQLTEDIAVQAALSDDNLPVVPEGNTEELRDVDRVLVELTASHWRATLGDFVAQRQGTVYGDYRRKLQGISMQIEPPGAGIELLAGSPRGVYRTIQIRGEEANQGPYRLGTGEVGDDLFIVAGSERVSLDGERLTRGADRDYVVDYVRGSVTFTYRRLITAESTIVVEFEEGEGPYSRTVIGAGAEADFTLPLAAGLTGGLAVRLTRERDDPQRLRAGELDENDQAALAAAGDDLELAVAEGVVQVEPGQGTYRAEQMAGQTIYVYDPENGSFRLSFFFLGGGLGDYSVDSLTVTGEKVFSFRGPGAGSYRIGRPLPLPEQHHMVTVSGHLGPEEQPHFQAEWDLSTLDRNQVSDLDDQDNRGTAWVISGQTPEGLLKLGGLGLGQVSLSGRHERRDANFRPFLLRKDLFTYDRWGLGARARRTGFLDERDSETYLRGLWSTAGQGRALKIAAEWGKLEHGASLAADRWEVLADWQLAGGRGSSRWNEAGSTDVQDLLDVASRRQVHQVSWSLLSVQPSLHYQSERWEDTTPRAAARGSRLRSWGGALASLPGQRWRWRAGFTRGLADSLRQAGWQRERDSRTTRVEVAAPPLGGMRLMGDATLRRILGPQGKEQTTRLAKLDLAGNWSSVGSDWSLSYSVDNSRSEVLDRQIVFVGFRLGDYNEAGEFVGRNLGDYNLTLVGTDSLVATTAVRADLSWRQEYRFLGKDSFWGAWSSMTRLGVAGRSQTDDIAGLLRLDPALLFADADVVLGEINFLQEATFLRHLSWLDLQLGYAYDEATDRQFAAHPENRLRRDYRARLTWSPTERVSLRLRSRNTDEQLVSGATVSGVRRSHDASTWRHEAEWALRPGSGNRVALAGELIRRQDAVSRVKQREWALRPSVRYQLEQRWSAQAEVRWANVTSEEPALAVRPFFFAVPGRNVEIITRLGWEPTDQLNVSLSYFGRQLGERGWQHDFRVESTARF